MTTYGANYGIEFVSVVRAGRHSWKIGCLESAGASGFVSGTTSLESALDMAGVLDSKGLSGEYIEAPGTVDSWRYGDILTARRVVRSGPLRFRSILSAFLPLPYLN